MSVYVWSDKKKGGGGGRLVVAGKERNDARMYNTCYIGENVSDFSSARV